MGRPAAARSARSNETCPPSQPTIQKGPCREAQYFGSTGEDDVNSMAWKRGILGSPTAII